MRLIDADKLRIEVVRDGWKVHTPHVSLDQIMLAEEVKAIPIKWIMNYLDIHTFGCGDFYEETYEMIENWEKENEIDR